MSPGNPASSTTKTGRHDRAEILLKVALKEKSYFSEIVLQNLPWKLLELSRNKRKFNIITNYTNHIFISHTK
jgi:hypothetical protein